MFAVLSTKSSALYGMPADLSKKNWLCMLLISLQFFYGMSAALSGMSAALSYNLAALSGLSTALSTRSSALSGMSAYLYPKFAALSVMFSALSQNLIQCLDGMSAALSN